MPNTGKEIRSGKTNIAMGNPPVQDVSPIQNGGFPLLCWFTRGYTLFKKPSFLIALPPPYISRGVCHSVKLMSISEFGSFRAFNTNLGSLVQTQRSLVETPEDAERNKKS